MIGWGQYYLFNFNNVQCYNFLTATLESTCPSINAIKATIIVLFMLVLLS